MIKTNNLLKKTGFYRTMELLSGQSVRFGVFYREFLKKGYINAFVRVKEEMVKQGLIEIYKSNNMKFIKLTPKGIRVSKALQRLIEVMS